MGLTGYFQHLLQRQINLRLAFYVGNFEINFWKRGKSKSFCEIASLLNEALLEIARIKRIRENVAVVAELHPNCDDKEQEKLQKLCHLSSSEHKKPRSIESKHGFYVFEWNALSTWQMLDLKSIHPYSWMTSLKGIDEKKCTTMWFRVLYNSSLCLCVYEQDHSKHVKK